MAQYRWPRSAGLLAHMMTLSFSVENLLASMILGGVFERHPGLRFGIIESGAQWLGPLVDRMESLWDHIPQMRKLSRRPSEYVAAQVRVTSFFFEPVNIFVDRYPQFVDAYCSSSDYRHSEAESTQ
jgi:hypothetical protein